MNCLTKWFIVLNLLVLPACDSEPYYFQLYPYPESIRPEQAGWEKMASVTVFKFGEVDRRVVVRIVDQNDRQLAIVKKEYSVGDLRADVNWEHPDRVTVTVYEGSPLSGRRLVDAEGNPASRRDRIIDRFQMAVR